MLFSYIHAFIIFIVINDFLHQQTAVNAQPRVLYERITNVTVEHTWLEVGFAYLDDINWLDITTKNMEFNAEVVAFVSLPDVGGSLYNESIPLVPKLKQLPYQNEDKTWTFTVKLVQARGSHCSTEWYNPVPIEPVQISWMVVEKNMFELSIYQTLLIDSSNITRNNSDSDLGDGSTNANGNFERIW
mgnify:FL=1